MDSRGSETRARVKITPREKRRHAAPHRVSPFSRGVIFTHARVSLPLLSLRTNGGLLEVYKKRTTLRGITKFSEPFSRKFSFHSTLLPEFLELSFEWFAFSFYGQGGTLWTICFQFILKKKKDSIFFLCISVRSLEFFATWFEYRSIVCN